MLKRTDQVDANHPLEVAERRRAAVLSDDPDRRADARAIDENPCSAVRRLRLGHRPGCRGFVGHIADESDSADRLSNLSGGIGIEIENRDSRASGGQRLRSCPA